MQFRFETAGSIIFGSGTVNAIGEEVRRFGKTALCLTGKSGLRDLTIEKSFHYHGIDFECYSVENEPTFESIENLLKEIQDFTYEAVVSVGGGSVIDTGKAVAAILTQNGDLCDYVEVIGKGKKFTKPPLPLIAVPTTAGSGTEVTKNAVIKSTKHKTKVSMRSNFLLPRVAIVDPRLTLSLPRLQTAATGLDALTQLIEPYVSPASNPLTDVWCQEGMQRISRHFRKAFETGSDLEARENMSFSSLLSGLCLANAKLGAVHGIAGPLGGMIDASHGMLCASLLPWVMEKNIALLQNSQNVPFWSRYQKIARLLTGDPEATPSDGVEWVKKMCEELEVPSLKYLGLNKEMFPLLIDKSICSSSMKGNPVLLQSNDLEDILSKAL